MPKWRSGGICVCRLPKTAQRLCLYTLSALFLRLSFSLFSSPLHSVETEAGVEYRIHSVPPRVYNPHHSTLAASTLSMHVLVNPCSFPVQTHKRHTQKHTRTRTTRSCNPSKTGAGTPLCICASAGAFFFVSLRYSRVIPPQMLV